MNTYPATTVRITGIEPAGTAKVRISLELIVDVNRLADVSGELLSAVVHAPHDRKGRNSPSER